jgi:hypothetical protein
MSLPQVSHVIGARNEKFTFPALRASHLKNTFYLLCKGHRSLNWMVAKVETPARTKADTHQFFSLFKKITFF